MKRAGIAWPAVLALIVTMSACSSAPPATPGTEVQEAADNGETVGPDGIDINVETASGTVTISGGPDIAQTGTPIAFDSVEAVEAGSDSALVLAPSGISITLGDGQQPQAPLDLEFHIGEADTTFDGLDDDVVPVVVATSDEDPDSSELLPATWDPATRILSATTTHLSEFRAGTLDYAPLRKKVEENVEGFVGSSSDAPSCLGSSVTIGEKTYDAIVPAEGVVYPCVTEKDGRLAVTLYSNSPLGWTIRSVPPPAGSAEMSGLSFTSGINSALYGSLLGSDVGDGALMHARGATELLYDTADVPRRIDLRAQAAMTLVDVGMHGTSMIWGGNKFLDYTNPGDLETFAQCITDPIAWDKVASASGREVGEMSRKATDCTNNAIGWGLKSEDMKIGAKAREKLGDVMNGLASFPKSAELLGTTITGLGGEFNGRNTATVIIRARGGDSVDTSGLPDEVFTIDRFELDNRLTVPAPTGRKIGPYLYELSTGRTSAVDVSFGWSAITIDDENYTGEHCQITATLEGPEANQHEDIRFGRCTNGYASSFGGMTKFRVQTPGVYTIRLYDAVTELSAESTFTVQR